MPLMIIGNAEQPRLFHKKYGQELDLDYLLNRKSWMSQKLFYAWLKRLHRYAEAILGRRILPLADSCSAHGRKETFPVLENVRVEFPLPNTTSKTQSLDAGTTALVKAKYGRRLLLSLFENLEARSKNAYSVDVPTAIMWIERD